MELGINFNSVLALKNNDNITLAESLKKLKNLGITAVDIEYSQIKNEEYAKTLLLNNYKVSTVYTFGKLGKHLDYSKELEVIDFCSQNSIKSVMFLTEFEENENFLKDVKSNLRRIVNYAKNLNVTVMIENFSTNKLFSTVEGLEDILKSVKNLKLLYDSGNFILAEEDPFTALQKLYPFVYKVHLKDRDFKKDYLGSTMQLSVFKKETYVYPLGEGISKIYDIIAFFNEKSIKTEFVLEGYLDGNVYEDIKKSIMNITAI